MQETFNLDELVWAKLAGYPWWPSKIIAKNEKQEYLIVFLAEFTRCYLPASKLKQLDRMSLEVKGKTKDVGRAIKMARRIVC